MRLYYIIEAYEIFQDLSLKYNSSSWRFFVWEVLYGVAIFLYVLIFT